MANPLVSPTVSYDNVAIDNLHLLGDKKYTLSANYWDYDSNRTYSVASSCRQDNTDAKGIQRVIKELQNAISTIKRFSNINSAVSALINEDVEPGKTIKKVLDVATGDIAGYVKNIIGRARGWVLNEIQNRVKKVLPFLFPGEVPSFLDKLNKGINGLSCAFAKIIRGLAKVVGNLLLDLIEEYINGPMCLVEDFIGKLLGNIVDPITNAINAINSFLGDAVGKVANLADSLFNAIDFVTGILNFFKCDDDKSCPVVFEIDRSGKLGQGGDVAGNLTGTGALKYAEGKTKGESTAPVDAGITSGSALELF